MEHRTRIDWWLLSLIGGFTGLCLVGGIFLMLHQADWPDGLLAVGLALALLATSCPTRYRITPETLRIRAGVFLWKIPLAAIRAAVPSNNPIFAPAWSLNRLRIDYDRTNGKRSFVLVSPRDRRAFLADLAQATSGLELDGDRLRRPAAGIRGKP
jgi:hypothetical protein